MPKKAVEQGSLWVKTRTKAGVHFVGGVAGLALQVLPTGGRTWVLRVMVGGRRREIGLGGYPDVTLAGARDKAREARDKIVRGIDPVAERRAARSSLDSKNAATKTFEQCADAYMAAKAPGWKNAKHGAQWAATLKAYAYPVMGKLPVQDVVLAHVMSVLEPIWTTKPETASRVRNRIELVIDWAAARGYRDKDNPARWRGHLDKLLAAPTKIARVQHFAALPIDDMHSFMERLRQVQGMGALALEFAILTAARSGEARGATWAEIDREGKVWTIPAVRMKGGREHRVPLSDAALVVLDKALAMPRPEEGDLVFPAARGGPLSDMTLTAVLRRMKLEATVHGFRSCFRDWAAERTSFPPEAAELALAHAVGNKVEAAYRRGDLFERRRVMMNAWAEFIDHEPAQADVLPLHGATHAVA
jgi:integrase